MNGLVVVNPIEEDVTDVLAEVAGVALDVRAQGIKIDERGRFDLVSP